MVAVAVLEAAVERRGGSSPPVPTKSLDKVKELLPSYRRD